MILAIVSTMVGLAWRAPSPETADVQAVLSHARTLAVRSAEPLRVEIRDTGGWQIRAVLRDAILAQGALNDPKDALAVDIDALGTCHPVPVGARADSAAAFDPLRCRWRPVPVGAL